MKWREARQELCIAIGHAEEATEAAKKILEKIDAQRAIPEGHTLRIETQDGLFITGKLSYSGCQVFPLQDRGAVLILKLDKYIIYSQEA